VRVFTLVVSSLLAGGALRATPTLNGDTVTVNYLSPDFTTLMATQTMLVGTPLPEVTCSAFGTGVCSVFVEPGTISIHDLSIIVTEEAGNVYATETFNGFQFAGLDFGDGSTLTGFNLITDLPGLTPANVSFTGNSIAFNASGLSFLDSPYSVELDLVTSSSNAPEPGAFLLLGSGLTLIGLLRRRRRR
jgi:hypothetical protein